MQKKYLLNEERDIPLLKFLWKWKLMTTAGLTARFFSRLSPVTAYKHLWRLQQGRYLEAVSLGGARHFAWALSRKGFRIVRPHLPPLKEEGWRSEFPKHDLLVSGWHLGECIYGGKSGFILFSEQQLRRVEAEFWPQVIPKSGIHRPDGYTVVTDSGQSRVVALEVELTAKRTRDYEFIADFYSSHPDITTVQWVVPKKALGDRIGQLMSSEFSGPRHEVIVLENFKRQPAGRNNEETSQKHVSLKTTLNTALSPHRCRGIRSLWSQYIP